MLAGLPLGTPFWRKLPRETPFDTVDTSCTSISRYKLFSVCAYEEMAVQPGEARRIVAEGKFLGSRCGRLGQRHIWRIR